MMESERIWREFTNDLCKHFTRDNVKRLCYYPFCIPQGDAEEIENGLQLMKHLEEKDKISKDNIEMLYCALDAIPRKDLKKKLDNYKNDIQPILEKERKEGSTFIPIQSEDDTVTNTNQQHQGFVSPYKMTREPRGLCIIINNMFDSKVEIKTPKGDILGKRNGSDFDRDALENLFTWLKFKVKKYNNVSHSYLETLLTLHSDKDEKNDLYDCFVCCVLSHGYEKGFYCNDGRTMDFSDLRSFFQGKKCPDLVGKPKLFFIQACQGNQAGGWSTLTTDGPPRSATANYQDSQTDEMGKAELNKPIILSADADFLLFVSSVPGYVSWRDKKEGTWFIQELTKVFIEGAESQHLLELCLEVNRRISEKTDISSNRIAKMMSDFGMNSLRQRLFFNPGGPYKGPYNVN